MVVLQLGPYPPPHGGVQTNLVAIREHLLAHGIEAPVINLTRPRGPRAQGVHYPRTAWQLLRLLLTCHADILHVHIGGNLTARLVALCFLCSLLPRRKVVLTFHSGGYPSSPAGRRARARSFAGFVFRRLDAVIAVNEEIAGLFRRFGVRAERIHVICPYVAAAVRPDVRLPESLDTFRRRHRPLLVTVGLLEPEYDLGLQITTLGRIREHFPDAGLAIIGSGSLEGRLRTLIAEQPHAPHILLCGDVDHAATLKAIAESDAVLRTTLYDGDSVSVREALELGVPVIATDNGMRPAGVHLLPRAEAESLAAVVGEVVSAPRAPRPSGAPARTADLAAVVDLYRTLCDGHELVRDLGLVRGSPK